MHKRFRIAVTLLAAALALWWGKVAFVPTDREGGPSGSRRATGGGATAVNEGETSGRSGKASVRETGHAKATHAAIQLKDFFLGDVDIDGLPLRQALEKLRAAYEEACHRTDETPLELRFHLPTASGKSLHLKLGANTVDRSIRLLAAVSGMKVRREGADFHFEEIPRGARPGKRDLQVPPDFGARLAAFAGGDAEGDPRAILESLGIVLNPATKLSFDSNAATLSVDAADGRDAATAMAMLKQMTEQSPIQHKMDLQVLEIPSGNDWQAPDLKSLDRPALEALLADLASRSGIERSALPSITARDGENATIEMSRELIMPKDDNETEFEKHDIGKAVQLRPRLIGLGSHVNMNFRDVRADFDKDSGEISMSSTQIEGGRYALDGSTWLLIQSRPDGSRTLVLLTDSRVDATGRLIGAED